MTNLKRGPDEMVGMSVQLGVVANYLLKNDSVPNSVVRGYVTGMLAMVEGASESDGSGGVGSAEKSSIDTLEAIQAGLAVKVLRCLRESQKIIDGTVGGDVDGLRSDNRKELLEIVNAIDESKFYFSQGGEFQGEFGDAGMEEMQEAY